MITSAAPAAPYAPGCDAPVCASVVGGVPAPPTAPPDAADVVVAPGGTVPGGAVVVDDGAVVVDTGAATTITVPAMPMPPAAPWILQWYANDPACVNVCEY